MTSQPVPSAAYDTLVAARTLISLDIETATVADPQDPDATRTYPISVGAVVAKNGTERDTFHTLINPGVGVDEGSSDYNGITTEDLASAPDTAGALTLLDDFLAQFPEAVIVCHNARFDLGYLKVAYDTAGMPMFDRMVMDTQHIPSRLGLSAAAGLPKLTTLAERYQVSVGRHRRTHKALADARVTSRVLHAELREASQAGHSDFDTLAQAAKATTVAEVAAQGPPKMGRIPVVKPVPQDHIQAFHTRQGLPAEPTEEDLAEFVQQAKECVRTRCPYLVEKTTVAAGTPGLLAALSALLSECSEPGEAGTLLGALAPLLTLADRSQARKWYETHHTQVKATPACEGRRACPACAADAPCPKDITYHLIARRAMDYGLTQQNKPVSWFSRKVKDDVWDKGRHRKIDTWTDNGRPELAAYVVWLLIDKAQRANDDKHYKQFIGKAVERSLQQHDPRLALVVAKDWSLTPQGDADIRTLAEHLERTATTDPGFLEFDIWFRGAYQQLVKARAAAAAEHKPPPPPKTDRKHTTAEVERRPVQLRHTYRFLPPRARTAKVQPADRQQWLTDSQASGQSPTKTHRAATRTADSIEGGNP